MNYADQKRAWEKRRKAIVADYRKTGNLSETGRKFTMSRERVRQIVAKEQARERVQE